MMIRKATMQDLDAITGAEAESFPPAEAAPREEFEKRLRHYAEHFWLMFQEDRLISFVDGFVTDLPDLTDEMYEKAEMHNPDGDWQMIFGVVTVPDQREKGCASRLMEEAIKDAREQGRKGLVLTCKDPLVGFYEQFGFKNEGYAGSNHGNVPWNQMRLTF